MTIFHFAFFFILLLNLVTRPKNSKKGKRIFFILSGLIYFCISAFRGYKVGFDTYNYFNSFHRLGNAPIASVPNFGHDFLFYSFMWLVRHFTNNFSVFLSLVALVFTVSCWIYLYMYSDDPCLSIIILLAFNLYQFTLTGLRQTVAMSLILIVLIMLKKKKVLLGFILTLVAAQFHKSAYVFLVSFLVYKRKPSNQLLYLSIPALLVIFTGRIYIAEALIPFLSERGYGLEVTTGGLTMAFVVFSLYILAVVFRSENKVQNDESDLEYWMMIIAVTFEMLVTAQNIFFRFAFYFLWEGSILIPRFINSQKNRNNYTIMNIGLYSLLSIQYLFFTLSSSGIVPYSFFWQ